jgi:hypothetical protein
MTAPVPSFPLVGGKRAGRSASGFPFPPLAGGRSFMKVPFLSTGYICVPFPSAFLAGGEGVNDWAKVAYSVLVGGGRISEFTRAPFSSFAGGADNLIGASVPCNSGDDFIRVPSLPLLGEKWGI